MVAEGQPPPRKNPPRKANSTYASSKITSTLKPNHNTKSTQSLGEGTTQEVFDSSSKRNETNAQQVFDDIPEEVEIASNKVECGPPTNASFSSLFKNNRDTSNDELKIEFYEDEGQIVKLTDNDIVKDGERFGYCLVGHFTGRFPGLKAVHELKNSWKVGCSVKPHEKGWVIFQFECEKDRMSVLEGGPYSIFGKTLVLRCLPKGFTFDSKEFFVVPIWIRLPRLPLECWKKEALGKIASKVGKPICMDKVTKECTKIAYARLLVEVDVSKVPTEVIPIELPCGFKFEQKVDFENYPNYCCKCEKYGHNILECKPLEEVVLACVPEAKDPKQGELEVEAAPCIEDLKCRKTCKPTNQTNVANEVAKGGECAGPWKLVKGSEEGRNKGGREVENELQKNVLLSKTKLARQNAFATLSEIDDSVEDLERENNLDILTTNDEVGGGDVNLTDDEDEDEEDDPDVVEVSELTFELVTAVRNRNGRPSMTKEKFESMLANIIQTGAEFVEIL